MDSGMCSPCADICCSRSCFCCGYSAVILRVSCWAMVMYVDVLDAAADDDDECGWIAAGGRR